MKNGKKLALTIIAGVLAAVLLAVLLWRFGGQTSPDAGAPQTATCTIAIRCETILDNLEDLNPEKAELVPPDGVLMPETSAEFLEGESALDLLKRVCQEQSIHLDFSTTPGYGSAYLKGIGNLYEFDCGDRSGWLYKVNGQRPDQSCSDYLLQPEDRVEFLYSCSWGDDLT